MAKSKFTEAHDLLIRSALTADALRAVARQLERPIKAVRKRRSQLRRAQQVAAGEVVEPETPAPPAKPIPVMPFSRPAWFDEDLSLMTKGGVAKGAPW